MKLGVPCRLVFSLPDPKIEFVYFTVSSAFICINVRAMYMLIIVMTSRVAKADIKSYFA